MKGKWSGSSSSSGFGFSTQNLLKHLAVAKALHAAIFQVSLSTSPSLLFCWHSFLPLLASCSWIVVAMTSSHPTPTFPLPSPPIAFPPFPHLTNPNCKSKVKKNQNLSLLTTTHQHKTLRNHTSPHLAIPPTNFLESSQIGENPKPQFFFFFFFFFSPLWEAWVLGSSKNLLLFNTVLKLQIQLQIQYKSAGDKLNIVFSRISWQSHL